MTYGLFYTTRNITGTFSAGLLCNLRILETQVDQIDFLTTNKTNKCVKHIKAYTGLKIGQWLNYVLDLKGDTWEEVYDSLDPYPLAIYDKLFIMGGIHFPQSNLSRGTERASKFPIGDKGQLKFQQVAKHVVNVMIMHKAHVHYKIPLHEFCYETDEMTTSDWQVPQMPSHHHKYHVYDIPRYDMKRLDSLQYYFKHKPTRPLDWPPRKVYDLIFGYTLYANGNRPAYVDWINQTAKKFTTKQIYVKDAIEKEKSTIIPFEAYLHKIEQAQYTLVIPSYDSNTFSMYRFIEAIQRNCLPILHPECNVTDAEKSFGINLKQLMVDDTMDLARILAVDRNGLIEYYRQKLTKFERNFIR